MKQVLRGERTNKIIIYMQNEISIYTIHTVCTKVETAIKKQAKSNSSKEWKELLCESLLELAALLKVIMTYTFFCWSGVKDS